MYYHILKNTVFTTLLLISSSMYGQVKPHTHKAKKSTEHLLPIDPAVRMGKLPNGFTFYIRHNQEPKNRVVMYLVNKAGSILEDEDQRGLAHFTEHMSFNGTTHFPHNELVDYLQKAGVRFGADINAYTSFDETVYELPLPADKPAILDKGILIMHDWAQSATLDPVEIDKERGVVLEEKRLGKGSNERMQRQYWPVILNNSRYAERIPIGLDTILNNFKRPAIARFYKDWYRPDLQALIIVGDINADSIEKVVKAKFGDLKNPAKERPRTDYKVLLSGKNHFIAVTDKEMTSTVAEVIIKHKQQPLKTAADYRRGIGQNLFNQMLADRYAELYRTANPPFIQGRAGISGFMGGLDSYDVSVTAKPGELEKGFKAVWRETERLKRFGFTITELDRAKEAYLNRMEAALKEKDKTNSESFVREYQANFLNAIAAPGIIKEYELVKASLPLISLHEVNELTTAYITGINRDILIQAPYKNKDILPDEATFNGWIKAVEQERLKPYKDEVTTKSLLASTPIPGKITDEKKNEKLGLINLTLGNGVKVIIKPTDFKNNEILFNAFAPGGTSLYSDTDFQSAVSAAGIITANGVGNYNANQIDKYLEGKQLSVRPFISERFAGMGGSTVSNDLETALQLVYAYFTEPRKDTSLFRGIIERSKANLANRGNDPNVVFSDTVSAVLSNNNIRRTGPSLEKLSQVNLNKAYAIYKECFADASGFTFVFVGNIDAGKLKPLLEKYLGALPATHSSLQAKDLDIHIPGGEIEKTVYKGTEPKATAILVYSGKMDYSPASRINLDALKEILQIRLLERLREDESGVYSPGVSAGVSKYPEARYSLVIQFGCAPQNADKLIASARDEVAKLRQDGPSEKNIEKWRAEAKASRETQLKTNGFWLNYISAQLQNNNDLDELNNYTTQLDKVSALTIRDMAGTYLSENNFIRLELLPETNNDVKNK